MLGTPDYWRLRLGIGHPGVKTEVIHYVLKKPAPDQRDAIHMAISKTLAATDAMLAGDMDKALTQVHAQPPRPKPPKPAAAAVAPLLSGLLQRALSSPPTASSPPTSSTSSTGPSPGQATTAPKGDVS
jgi:Peptidyl-tRNA hydrolase